MDTAAPQSTSQVVPTVRRGVHPHQLCQECGKQAFSVSMASWRVDDSVWKLAGYAPRDVACKKCFIKRLRKNAGLKGRTGFIKTLVLAARKIEGQVKTNKTMIE